MLYRKIEDFIDGLKTDGITEKRKLVLQPLIDYISERMSAEQEIRLNFICTHNSRRSHLSQVWAQVMAHKFNIKNVYCYSGGTEATALFPKVAETLSATGFIIVMLSQDSNPVYSIKFAEDQHPVIGFSKKYDDTFNPASHFAAIMTCSSADKGCPFIAGAEMRIPLTFTDPKAFDNTPQQSEEYLKTSKLIATELKYVFSKIN